MIKSKEVLRIVSLIPKGKLTTYKMIALRLNSNAYRAVGKIISMNKDYANIPCHRVVNSNGSIGGYNRGVRKKIELLKSEGIEIKHNKISELDNYLFRL